MRFLVFDKVIAAFAPIIGCPSRNGKYLSVVSVGQIRCHQTAAFLCGLDDYGSFTDSSNNSVTFLVPTTLMTFWCCKLIFPL